jgi:hypothetical protein
LDVFNWMLDCQRQPTEADRIENPPDLGPHLGHEGWCWPIICIVGCSEAGKESHFNYCGLRQLIIIWPPTHTLNKNRAAGQQHQAKAYLRPCAGELFKALCHKAGNTHITTHSGPIYRVPAVQAHRHIISSLQGIWCRLPRLSASLDALYSLARPPTIPFTLVQPFNYFILFGLLDTPNRPPLPRGPISLFPGQLGTLRALI